MSPGTTPKNENNLCRSSQRKLSSGLDITHDHLLGKKISILQPKEGFRVGTDAVFLAASLNVNHGRILDLGAGVGGVSLCLARRLDKAQITAVELDPILVSLARRNVLANGFDGRIQIVSGNVGSLPQSLSNSFDHVVSNPPYHYAAGTKPQNSQRALAHMGDDLTLGEWVKAALWAVKPRGRISFICRADRGAELINLFTMAGASEALQFPLWPKKMVPAGRIIIQVRKSVCGPGAILPGLVVHSDDGTFTDAANRIMKGDGLYMVHPARGAQ